MAWYKDVTRRQWKTLAAAQLGWLLDAMDVMLYAFALTAIRDEFHLSSAAAGALASVTLVTSAFGGVIFGLLADRFGRARVLMLSIVIYSLFTAMTATARTVSQLAMWRALVGVGLGGEWSSGAVLVAETWPAAHRGKAVGIMQSGWAIGYIIAAILAALVLPAHGWRPLFAIGLAPALLTLWIRRSVPEPETWREAAHSNKGAGRIFRFPLVRRTLIASLLTTTVLFAYWGLFTWIPSYLSSPVSKGGAGLSIFASSAWIIPMQLGAFCGYILFGWFADRFGRRPVFIAFVLGAAVLVPIYGHWGRYESVLMLLGPLVGFFGHGYFSVFGAMLSELFPVDIRATGQGLCYNVGRGISAMAPFVIGSLADQYGIGTALALPSLFYVIGAALILLLPETKGESLA